jgi:ketosteroid isomerase-like protein
MVRLALATALLLATAPAYASDQTDIMAVINKMNDAMNKNDMKTAAGTYTANAALIDEFPPHFWSGSGAFDTWAADYATFAKAQGDTDARVKMERPAHLSVNGDRAYAVVPSVLTFKEHGKKVSERGLWTFAMQKSGSDWKIAGWAWATR